MNITEVGELVREVQGMWPKWNPEEAELLAWRRLLSRLDLGRAREAFAAHWETARANSPQAGPFRTEYYRQNPAAQDEARAHDTNPNGYSGVVVCRIGTTDCRPLYYGKADNRTNPGLPSPYRVMQDAERMRAQLQRMHGGEWRIYQRVQQGEIIELAHRVLSEPLSQEGVVF